MNLNDLVWWWHTPQLTRWGLLRELGEQSGVELCDTGEMIYLDPGQLRPAAELPDGVYRDIDDRVYHAHPSLSASGARLLLPPSVPAKYHARIAAASETKQHFEFGKLVHRLVLGKGADITVIDAPDWRSKYAREERQKCHDNGVTAVLASEFQEAELMRGAVHNHPVAADLLSDGDAEVSLFTTLDNSVRLRARPDWMTQHDGRLWLVDLKTCQDANPTEFGRVAARWSYHLQFAWYTTVARMLELDTSPAFVFVCVEKEPPYLVSVNELDAEAFQLGFEQMADAIGTYKWCMDKGEWPGYSDGINPIRLPPWAYSRSNQPTIGDLLEVGE